MRFLIDQSMSWWIAEQLAADGHEALHVRDVGLQHAPDDLIFERAQREQRTIVAADTDFGTIAARLRSPGPSIILFRHEAPDAPPDQVRVLRSIIAAHGDVIVRGCIIVVDGKRVRIRMLPID